MRKLSYIPEPNILLGHGQKMPDPRDGLTLFGPLPSAIREIRSGVVATKEGYKYFQNFLKSIQSPVYNSNSISRPFFPGFEAAFGCSWSPDHILFKEISQEKINEFLYVDSTHVRTYDMVSLFIEPIVNSKKNDDENIDVWFIIVPDIIHKYCRPKSTIPKELIKRRSLLSKAKAKIFSYTDYLFSDMRAEEDKKADEVKKYSYDAQFHDQLKARLLPYSIPTQILRESKIAWRAFTDTRGKYLHDFSKIEGHQAWSISTAAYYKAGGKPWKLSDIRAGVCYLGLVYKQLSNTKDVRNACCAAQMFLDSGDGTIFRGEVGPWFNPETKEYHLQEREAKQLLTQALDSYRSIMNKAPAEIFIHAKTRFNEEEWAAFKSVTPSETNIVGITISNREPLKLYRKDGDYPIPRGMFHIINKWECLLWTTGYIPRLQTTSAMEIPRPIQIRIDKGVADLKVVATDILSLTKLNYNACIYGDGIPVTLRFADKVGEILTACPELKTPPLAFKYYI
ncbi:hypothetical protein FYJ85_00030 [Victivallaceae bacterium BBE-744-WT-12]|uniref:Piwi domain-containing protein n=1 Tax=Victivallis lenta TaxID=2606640 RepID=A0A844FW74_9BACT|nr:hypothetical protein [Victivallis lenta]MST95437.1 hypothetical protein [Victivallis lenta]